MMPPLLCVLLTERVPCESQNVSIKCPCALLVYFCLLSGVFFIFSVKVSPFYLCFWIYLIIAEKALFIKPGQLVGEFQTTWSVWLVLRDSWNYIYSYVLKRFQMLGRCLWNFVWVENAFFLLLLFYLLEHLWGLYCYIVFFMLSFVMFFIICNIYQSVP